MRITPLDVMLKTPVVKVFLKNKTHEAVVTHDKHGYASLIEFFKDKYKDYKENGSSLGFANINSELLIYNIECDMEAMYKDCGLVTE